MKDVSRLVDARGLVCPEPLMMLHAAVRDVNKGEWIKLIATDPSTDRDITRFCEFLDHELKEKSCEGEEMVFLICKG